MQYQTFPPPPDLADMVEHFWAVENAAPLPAPHREILIPNGRPTVLVCLGDPGARIAEGSAVVPNASNIAGPLTRPIVLEQSGVSSYAAAQLHPWGLAALSAGPLVDASVPLDEVATETARASANAPFGSGRIAPVADLLRRLRRPLQPARLDAIGKAVALVDGEQGLMEVEALTAALGVRYDALYRLFKAMTGLSPKQYLSIVRFYAFTGELLKGEFGSLALLANLKGYYDQPHATREFRRFTGISQTRFRKQLNGIARLMHGQD